MFYKRVSALEVYVTYFTMNFKNFNLDLVGNEDSLKEIEDMPLEYNTSIKNANITFDKESPEQNDAVPNESTPSKTKNDKPWRQNMKNTSRDSFENNIKDSAPKADLEKSKPETPKPWRKNMKKTNAAEPKIYSAKEVDEVIDENKVQSPSKPWRKNMKQNSEEGVQTITKGTCCVDNISISVQNFC